MTRLVPALTATLLVESSSPCAALIRIRISQAPEEEDKTRQRILQELRLASEADMDVEVKAKQAQAKRAEALFRLKQSEWQAAGGTPQPLRGNVSAAPHAM